MNATDFLSDIPLSAARAAHQGTSHDPDRRADQEIRAYVLTLSDDYAVLLKHATTDEKRAALDEEFTRYREGYRARFVAMLSAKSRCVSTMIAGPSNFNTRKYGKANDSADKRRNELHWFRERALDAIRKTLHPEWRPIMTGDADAVDRVDDKLAKLKDKQAKMKAVNAAIRKNAKAGIDAQVAAIVALGFSDGAARGILKPDFANRIGFPAFELTNNAANIRRLEGRKVVIERVKAEPETVIAGDNARFEDAPADNRVRLYFSGKPAAEIRDSLKSKGFRWTPSMGCWQAYRHDHTIALAKTLAGIAS
jgi:hypothetical protein